jgi:hypothetical protein
VLNRVCILKGDAPQDPLVWNNTVTQCQMWTPHIVCTCLLIYSLYLLTLLFLTCVPGRVSLVLILSTFPSCWCVCTLLHMFWCDFHKTLSPCFHNPVFCSTWSTLKIGVLLSPLDWDRKTSKLPRGCMCLRICCWGWLVCGWPLRMQVSDFPRDWHACFCVAVLQYMYLLCGLVY